MQGLDDMEDDILGSLTTKKKPAAAAKKPSLSQTMPAKSSLASGKGAAKPAASKPKFDINDIMGDDGGDNFDSFLSSKWIMASVYNALTSISLIGVS